MPLDTDYALSAERLLERVSGRTRLVCLCSPNTPTGNLLSRKEILRICEEFSGLVIVDESYVGFSGHRSLVSDLPAHSNLVLLESLSATYALAGLRVAMIYAHPDVIRAVEVVRPPHNINLPALDIIAQLPVRRFEADKWVKLLTDERSKVIRRCRTFHLRESVSHVSQLFPDEGQGQFVRSCLSVGEWNRSAGLFSHPGMQGLSANHHRTSSRKQSPHRSAQTLCQRTAPMMPASPRVPAHATH